MSYVYLRSVVYTVYTVDKEFMSLFGTQVKVKYSCQTRVIKKRC